MRRVGRQYLRQEIRPTPRKTGGGGIKRPRNNGQDKGMAYPRRHIRKALSGYRSNNRRHTREVSSDRLVSNVLSNEPPTSPAIPPTSDCTLLTPFTSILPRS